VNYNFTYYIIGANFLVFLIGVLRSDLIPYLALNPFDISKGYVWQLLTFSLVEPLGNLWSLVFNMLALFFFGTQVEHEMGSWEFLLFYAGMSVLNGLFAFLLIFIPGAPVSFVYGSSGLVSGVMLAFGSFYPNQSVYVFGIFPLSVPILMLIVIGFLVLNIILGGPMALVHLFAIFLAFLYMRLRYGKNLFSELFGRGRFGR